MPESQAFVFSATLQYYSPIMNLSFMEETTQATVSACGFKIVTLWQFHWPKICSCTIFNELILNKTHALPYGRAVR